MFFPDKLLQEERFEKNKRDKILLREKQRWVNSNFEF